MVLHLPRTAWPVMCAFAATATADHGELERAVTVAHRRLEEKLAPVRARSAIRVATVDSDELDAALGDLLIDPGAHGELREFARTHPDGRVAIAYADYQPGRRTTVL